MKQFGTNEYGNKEGFKIICCKCGSEGWVIPTHSYADGEYKNPEKITLEFICSCGNKYGATIHEK